MSVDIRQGDCREVMRALPEASVDAIVTDPPYHFASIVKRFGADDAAPAQSNGATGVYERASAGFMGKKWDGGDIAFRPETWAAALRVLKPGGHMVAFGAPKNAHRLTCAIEDAGFEIRDVLMWVFGTGFPKSHDVAKAIDKAGGMSPADQAVLLRGRREAAGLSRETVAAAVGCTESSVRDWEEGRARSVGAPTEHIVPSKSYRAALADLLGYSSDERRLVGVAADRRADGTIYDIGHTGEMRSGGHTDAAAEWEGWGTALKPAYEPIILARKPLIGTVAENVLRYGTGAINVDACRVATDENLNGGAYSGGGKRAEDATSFYTGTSAGKFVQPLGRWPANLLHDGSDEVLAAFPETAPSKSGKPRASASPGDGWGMTSTGAEYDDAGSAARFFYCAKASKADRAGSKHPTVKPISLMRWLCRLITPPGGVILDPFAGSGTTGQAATEEGFGAILIEREAEYLADIRRRLGVVPSLEDMLA